MKLEIVDKSRLQSSLVKSRLEFLTLFTPEEFKGITDLSSTDARVAQFLYVVNGETDIKLYSEFIKAEISYLVSTGALTAERSNTILAGQ